MTTAIHSKNALHAQYGGTDLTGVRESNVQVKGIGRTIFLRDSCYARTNHFIKETQPYSSASLHRYWYFPCARWFFVACAIVALASAVSVYIAVPVAVVMLGWLIILCQHCVVSCCTLPRVLRQPVVPGQQKLNQLYEVRVEQLTGVLLQAHEAGIGYVETRTGMVKLQTFSPRAVGHMQRARIYSMIMLTVSLLLFIYAAGSSAVLGWNKYSEQLSTKYCGSMEYNCVSCLNNTKTVDILFLHLEIDCAFTLDPFECLGVCGVSGEEGTGDYADSVYTHLDRCNTTCVKYAEKYCTVDQVDRVCGVQTTDL